jgi:hypothetical protein
VKYAYCAALGVAVLIVASLHATPVQAQRVFVAAQGSDGNPCTFALPCRTFQHAHDTVAAGGEIDVLDPAGYGAVTITKSISIQGHGFAGISVATGGTGITINAAAADAVNLAGLLIDGAGFGINGPFDGIVFNSGKSLVIENCMVRNMGLHGLHFVSNAATLQTLSVANSYFLDSEHGILIESKSTGAISAAIQQTVFYGDYIWGMEVFGANGTGPINVAVTDSVASNGGAGSGGFLVVSDTGSVSNLVLTRVRASGNTGGIAAVGANAIIRLAQSTVTGNTSGYSSQMGGQVLSYGDNVIDDNGGNGGTLGSATKQ